MFGLTIDVRVRLRARARGGALVAEDDECQRGEGEQQQLSHRDGPSNGARFYYMRALPGASAECDTSALTTKTRSTKDARRRPR